MSERGSEHWSQVLAGLAADTEKAEAALAGIAAQRRPLALASLTGDLAAAEAVDRLNRSEGELRGRIATLKDAAEDAEGRRLDAVAAEEAAHAAERLHQLRAAALVHDSLAGEVDHTARALAQALTACRDHATEMRRYGLEPHLVAKLRNLTMQSGSLHLAGVSAAGIALPACGPSFRETSQNWARRMLAGLLPPDRAPASRHAAQTLDVLTPAEVVEMAEVAEVENAA